MKDWIKGSYDRENAGNGKRYSLLVEICLFIWVIKLKKSYPHLPKWLP
jgi:hypothetical protein